MPSTKKWSAYNLASIILGGATTVYSLGSLVAFSTLQKTEVLAILIATAFGLYLSISAFKNLKWLGRTFSIISITLLATGVVFPIWGIYKDHAIQQNGVFCNTCTKDSEGRTEGRAGNWEHRKDGKVIWSQFFEDSGGSYFPEGSKNAVLAAKKSGKWGLVDIDGKPVSSFKFDQISLYAQSEIDLIPVKVGELWGLINIKGEIVVFPRYKSIGRFNKKGILAVEHENSLWGYIDIRGNEMVKATFTRAGDMVDVANESAGVAVVEESDRCSFINGNGKKISNYYQICATPIEGDAEQKIRVKDLKSGKFGYININGEVVIKALYKVIKDDIISSSRSNGRPAVACVATDEKFGVINIRGELISQEKNDECDTVMKDDKRIAAILKRNGNSFTLFIDGGEKAE